MSWTITSPSGNVPVQGEAANEAGDFAYFRARGTYASVEIWKGVHFEEDTETLLPVGEADWSGTWGGWGEFLAGWISHEEALSYFQEALEAYDSGSPGFSREKRAE
jgi:hypothetical protein